MEDKDRIAASVTAPVVEAACACESKMVADASCASEIAEIALGSEATAAARGAEEKKAEDPTYKEEIRELGTVPDADWIAETPAGAGVLV